jgi:hypothetical protein
MTLPQMQNLYIVKYKIVARSMKGRRLQKAVIAYFPAFTCKD